MIGTVFIIIGLLILVFGVVLLLKSNKDLLIKDEIREKKGVVKKENTVRRESVIIKNENKVFDIETKKQELENLIKIAVSDGVLTPNEKRIIFKKATELKIKREVIEKKLSEELQKHINNPETKIIDPKKEKGNLFEGYVASKFDKKYFILKDWAGDKYQDGIYAESTTYPDLKYCFNLGDIEQYFAVECKYRSYIKEDKIQWAKKSQFENYKKYEQDFKIPVFVVIGLGQKANNPKEIFVIPLKQLKSTVLNISFLEKYKKTNFADNNFHFNYKSNKLS